MSDVMTISKRTASGLEEVLRTLLLDAESKVPADRLRIVGAMSDGAIIEQGSNANGEWVRWSDGTQICYGMVTGVSLTFTAIGSFYQATHTVTSPAAFVNTQIVGCAYVTISVGVPWATYLAPTVSNIRIRIFDVSDRTELGLNIFWLAIGRWKA